jgi:hypothetical protein
MAEVKITTAILRRWISILETDGIGSKQIIIDKMKDLIK